MKSRTVLITGCSSGIGYYCAKALKRDGFRVFATARKDEDVQRLKMEGFEAYKLDLKSSESIKEAYAWVMEQSNGKLYALFNNAAYGQPGAVEDLSRDVLRAQFETNLFGTHELTALAIKTMREQGYGRIVQNSSVLGIVSLRFRGAYNASKYALEGLSDTMRLELKGSNIFLSLIEPGPIRSDFRKNALKKFLEHIDRDDSYFKEEYKDKLKALESSEDVPFTLGEDAVYKVLTHALNSPRPKERYFVTKPTYFFAFVKRILPTRWLDRMLGRVE